MPFKPGQSGNPNGRPRRGETLTEALRAAGEKQYRGKTRWDQLADTAWRKAIAGDDKWAKLIWDRLEGKVAETLNVGNAEGKPFAFTMNIGDLSE